jgi:hypothetical protein
MSAQNTARSVLMKQIMLLLGDAMVDVELDPDHLQLAITLGIQKLQQRSDGAMLEKDIFLHITKDQVTYKLPDEVQEIRRFYRNGVGAYTNGGINFDPVDAAFYNIYLLQPNRSGGLSTWDLYNGYLETAERVFASQYNFNWDVNSHTVTIVRRPTADEDVICRCWVRKTDDDLINDPYTGPWLRSYAYSQSKLMIGQARSKFVSGFPGPNGNVLLNGSELKQEATAELAILETELYNIVAGPDGYGFIIG